MQAMLHFSTLQHSTDLSQHRTSLYTAIQCVELHCNAMHCTVVNHTAMHPNTL